MIKNYGLEQVKKINEQLKKVNELNRRLAELGRVDDIIRASTNEEYQQKIFEELGI